MSQSVKTTTRSRGRIYANPARVHCGECPAMHELKDPTITVALEATRAGWDYTMTSGWVCPTCRPMPRLMDDEPSRVRHE